MLYLAATDGHVVEDLDGGPWLDWFVLCEGLTLIDSVESRSAVYHAVKRRIPEGTALLVAPLADDPKFKGMASGAKAWLEGRPTR